MSRTTPHVPTAQSDWAPGVLQEVPVDRRAAVADDETQVLDELTELEEMGFAVLQAKARERMGL